MRNIANVVHDLKSVINNHKFQVELLMKNNLTKADQQEIMRSVLYDSKLLYDYIEMLEVEAKKNKLVKSVIKN